MQNQEIKETETSAAEAEEILYTPKQVNLYANGTYLAEGDTFTVNSYDFAFGATPEAAAANYDAKLKEIDRLKYVFIELDREKIKHKKFYEEYDETAAALAKLIGLEVYFQDDEGVVYKTEKPSGTFVAFKDVAVSRTRRARDGEVKGSLSMKEAEAAGFVLPKEEKK